MTTAIHHYFSYDGETDLPEEGVADFLGQPHYFWLRQCLREPRTGLFDLAPIDSELLAWVNEWGEMWHRWDLDYHAGSVELNSHPKLPNNNPRFVQLADQIERRAQELRETSTTVVGKVNTSPEYTERMRPYAGKKWPVPDTHSPVLEVTWSQENAA